MRRFTVVLLIAGCTGTDVSPGGVMRTDSLGIQVVRSATPAWTGSSGWTIGDQPVVDIGSAVGDAAHELFGVVGAIRLADGVVAVANRGVGDIRFFGADGSHIHSAGQQGEGPGEFRRLDGIWPFRGDSILAWDGRLVRWTVFDRNGEVGRTFLPEHRGPNPSALPPLADGSVIISDLRLDPVPGAERPMYEEFLHFDAEGTFIDSLGSYISFTGIAMEPGTIRSPIFDARLVRTAGGDGYWIGPATDYEIQRYDSRGTLRSVIRWSGPDRRVDSEDVAAYKEAVLSGIRDENARRTFAANLDALPAREVFAAYQYAVPDRDGELWIREYDRPGMNPAASRQWTVIAADGHWRGMITLPAEFIPFDIGRDYVLGVSTDELDVEHVLLYTLERTNQ